MSPTPTRVRCYQCGRRQLADGASCARCGVPFRGLCTCGAEHGLYDPACQVCGKAVLPKRYPLRRHPALRAALWLPALALVVYGGIVALKPKPVEPWQIRDQADDAYQVGDYRGALELYRDLVVRSPHDADAKFNMAVCYRRLGHDWSVYVRHVQDALVIRPGMPVALDLMAMVEAEKGNVTEALGYAEEAIRHPGAPARAHRMVGELELRRPQPNLPRALAALRKAQDKGDESPGVVQKIAQIQMFLYRRVSHTALPPEVRASLAAARGSLQHASDSSMNPAERAAATAELALAVSEPEDAFRDVDAALRNLPESVPAGMRARLMILRGRCYLARNFPSECAAELVSALELDPSVETASLVRLHMAAEGNLEMAESVLTQAASRGDPTGSVRAVLAAVLLDLGSADALARATRAVAEARQRDSGNPEFAELEADVHKASGRLDDARRGYREAVQLDAKRLGPHVGLALLALSEQRSRTVRREGIENALADLQQLREVFGNDPRIDRAEGALHLALGAPDLARKALELAVERVPTDAGAWVLYAQALARSSDPDALLESAKAYGRARSLNPGDRQIVELEADTWMRGGRPANARMTCNSYLVQHPDDPQILRLRAQTDQRLGRWDRAVLDLRRVWELGEQQPDLAVELYDCEFRAGWEKRADALRAQVWDRLDEPVRAQFRMIETLRRSGVQGLIEEETAKGPSHLLLELHLREGNADAARQVGRELLSKDPQDGRAAQLLVLALLDTEDTTEAELTEAERVLAALGKGTAPGMAEFVRGRIRLARGDAEAAVEPLRVTATEYPNSSLALVYLGEALFRSGERVEALAVLRRAATRPLAPPAVRWRVCDRLVELSHASADLIRAEALAREATLFAPYSVPAVLRLAGLLHARGAMRFAAEVAETALAQEGLTPEDRVALRTQAVSSRFGNRQSDRAIVHLEMLRASDPDSSYLRLLTGLAHVNSGSLAEARQELEPLLRDEPRHALATLALIEVDLREGNIDAAVARTEAWRKGPTDKEDVALAVSLMLEGRSEWDRAIHFARAFLGTRPHSVNGAATLCRQLAASGNPGRAVAEARRFTDAAPPDLRIASLLMLGRIELAYGQDKAAAAVKAARIAEEVLESNAVTAGGRLEAQVLRAESVLARGLPVDAANMAEEIARDWGAQIPPTTPERMVEGRVRFLIGVAALSREHWAAAALQFSRCVLLDKRDWRSLNNLAWAFAHVRENVLQGHRTSIQLTEQLAPLRPSCWDTRAFAATAAGHREDALLAYSRARDLYIAAGPRQAASRARSALRYAKFLRDDMGKDLDAAEIAREILTFAPGTDEAAAAERLLATKE